MLVIRIEKWPHGEPRGAQLMGFATIANLGTGGRELGSYVVRLFKPGAGGFTRSIEQMIKYPLRSDAWRKGRIDAFPRLALGPWDLLFRALGAAVQKRNPAVPIDLKFGEPPVSPVDDEVP